MYREINGLQEGKILTGYPLINNARFIRFIAQILRGLADLIYGVRSGYPLCCIYAYITYQDRYHIKGIERVLCRKCYMKIKRGF